MTTVDGRDGRLRRGAVRLAAGAAAACWLVLVAGAPAAVAASRRIRRHD